MIQNAKLLGFMFLLALLTSGAVSAAEPNYDSIANKVVNQSLQIQPGEVVVINGNASQIKLMGALFVAVSKAGGEAVVQLNLPEAGKRALLETPIEHLKRLPTFGLYQARGADCFINVTSTQDPDLLADVPEDRLAASRQASAPLNDAFRNLRFRSTTLGQIGGIPSEAYAKSVGADYSQLSTMFWKAVDVNPSDLASTATKVTGKLNPGTNIRITSKEGTDLTLKIGEIPARINAGRTQDVVASTGPLNAWLPAGEAYVCLDESSASGNVVVPRTDFRGVTISNLKITFKDGRMTAFTADSGKDLLQKFFDASRPNLKNLTVIDFGLNPNIQPLANSHYLSWEMGGIVSVSMGNTSWGGCKNDADASFDLHLAGTTVTVGNEVLIKDGKLQ